MIHKLTIGEFVNMLRWIGCMSYDQLADVFQFQGQHLVDKLHNTYSNDIAKWLMYLDQNNLDQLVWVYKLKDAKLKEKT